MPFVDGRGGVEAGGVKLDVPSSEHGLLEITKSFEILSRSVIS